MYIQSFKQLIVWQKAMELVKEIYILTNKFPRSELYGLISQRFISKYRFLKIRIAFRRNSENAYYYNKKIRLLKANSYG